MRGTGVSRGLRHVRGTSGGVRGNLGRSLRQPVTIMRASRRVPVRAVSRVRAAHPSPEIVLGFIFSGGGGGDDDDVY